MKEANADLWKFRPADAICITTNATFAGDILKGTRRIVMGRGCALEAKKKFKGIDNVLAFEIARQGNVPIILMRLGGIAHTDEWNTADPVLVSFPVKHNWWEKADPTLIALSASRLRTMADEQGWKNITIPRPGCGNGQLRWEDVKPILEPFLDDRFTVVTNAR